MGLIREPEGVDLIVGPSILTVLDRQMISEIIANYRRTRKLPSKSERTRFRGRRKALQPIE